MLSEMTLGSRHIVLLFIVFSIVSIGILSFLPDVSAKKYGVGIPTSSAVPGCEETDECYIPSTFFIEIGDEIKWHNEDNVAHTVTSVSSNGPDGKFDSGLFTVYTTFLVKFDGKDGPGEPGVYDYICTVHPWKKGTIIVQRTILPPVIIKPDDIEVYAKDSIGARVTYDVFGFDDTDHKVQPYCHPRSGSFFLVGDTQVTCYAIDMTGNKAQRVSFTVTVNSVGTEIPTWIKNNAGFWCEDKIDDKSFIKGIQYLIDNDIIAVSAESSDYGGSQNVPTWIKNNTCLWSEGLISDNAFEGGLEFLISVGILRV